MMNKIFVHIQQAAIKITGFVLILLFQQIPARGQTELPACSRLSNGQQVSAAHLLGTPYRDLNPFGQIIKEANQWGMGTVYLQSGDSIGNRYLVYNAVGSNLLWIKYSNESSLLVDKSTVKGFTLISEKDQQQYAYEYFPAANWYYSDGDGAFFEVMVKDSVSLFRLSTIEKFPMSQDLKIHKYFFVSDNNEGLIRVMRNRRTLCMVLDHSKEFRKLLHSKHIRVNKPEGLKRAIEEYNGFIKAL